MTSKNRTMFNWRYVLVGLLLTGTVAFFTEGMSNGIFYSNEGKIPPVEFIDNNTCFVETSGMSQSQMTDFILNSDTKGWYLLRETEDGIVFRRR